MTVEIKELIRSPKQKLFVVKASVQIFNEEEITNHPAVQKIVGEKKFELQKGVDAEGTLWYLRLRD